MNKTGKTALRLLCVVLSVLMVMSVFSVFSVSADIIPEYQTFTSGHTTVTVHFDSSTDKFTTTVTAIPGTDGKMEDYSNSNKKFGDYFLTGDLIVAEGVTHIGDYAFVGSTEGGYYTGFEKITLPKSLKTIGAHAFEKQGGKEKRNIYIPASVEQIGEEAFASYNTMGVRFYDIVLGETKSGTESKLKKIGKRAFYNCTKSQSFVFPTSCAAEIGEEAFYNCTHENLDNIALTEFMGPIGDRSVGYYNAGSYVSPSPAVKENFKITVPNKHCQAYYYANDNGIPVEVTGKDDYGVTGACKWTYTDADKTLRITGKGAMGDHQKFSERPWGSVITDIEVITIEDGVTYIGDSDFKDCTKVDSITIPDSVTKIANTAFYGCKALEKVTLSKNLTSIGEYAFTDTAFRNITVPASVETIGECALGYENNPSAYKYDKVNLVINGVKDSAAEKYAKDNGFTFVEVDPETVEEISEVNLTVAEPELGKSWDCRPAVTGNCDYTGVGVWKDGKMLSDVDAPLEAGIYEVMYVLEPDPGYIFKCSGETIETIVYVNGKVATVEALSEYEPKNGLSVVLNYDLKEPATPPVETTEPVETTVPAETTEPTESSEPTSETTLPAETTNPVETTEPQTATDPAATTEPVATTEPQVTTAPVTTAPAVTAKKPNPVKVTVKTKTVKLKNLKKKNQTVKAITVKNAKGKVTYKLTSVPKKIKKLTKISSKGVITIKKWKKAKKGTYKFKVKITAAGNAAYKAKSKTVTVKVKIK